MKELRIQQLEFQRVMEKRNSVLYLPPVLNHMSYGMGKCGYELDDMLYESNTCRAPDWGRCGVMLGHTVRAHNTTLTTKKVNIVQTGPIAYAPSHTDRQVATSVTILKPKCGQKLRNTNYR